MDFTQQVSLNLNSTKNPSVGGCFKYQWRILHKRGRLIHAAVMEAFVQAAEEVQTLNEEPNQDEQAALQGLFKQATVGDINIERPGMMDVVGKANWDAWNSRRGLTKEEAMGLFCQLVENLKGKYGVTT